MKLRSILLSLSLSCTVAAPLQAADIAIAQTQIQRLGIRDALPQKADAARAAPWSARVVASPDAEWVVTAPAAGVVVRVPVAEGQQVAVGNVLAELRSADLPETGAALAQARAAAELARGNRERDRMLHAEGLIAERRLRESEAAAVHAEAALAAAQSRLNIMGVSPGDASAGRLMVRATASATVLERMALPGQRVNEADPLLRLADARKLMLELNLPAAQAETVREGELLAVDGMAGQARVTQIGWGAADATQTVRIRAELPASASGLRPGLWVKARRSQTPASAWSVDAAALVHHAGRTWLFAHTGGGYRAIEVTVLAQDAQRATVSGGLDGTQPVAVGGVAALKAVWLGHGGE
ncbi:efflux RND transporter periplasmic adaptor subunit [Methyloversatilis discipulorum]|uniref:efflux RND transporter periplasmic adaptor subunit n=2 Tax=Pseudomonadota TaxID=1224 RepID=UPI003137A2CD